MDLFRGQTLLRANGTKVAAETALRDKQYICIYFSAHWCPPCRGFTPKLKDFYAAVKDKGVEVVFVSSDRTPQDMMDYMTESHGDWLAAQHESTLSDDLGSEFSVSGIPYLVIVKFDGTVVTKDGRSDVMNHGAEAVERWREGKSKSKGMCAIS